MYAGNLSHTSGAALEKDISPNVFKFFYEVPQKGFFVRNEEISEFRGGGGGGGEGGVNCDELSEIRW